MSESEEQDVTEEASNEDVASDVEEPVLSDEEKEALLDGIENGEIEVHSAQGPRYAEVRDFVISPRAHMKTNSFPRLELLNGQFSATMSKTGEKLLNVPFRVFPGNIETLEFAEVIETASTVSVVLDFGVEPLEGKALMFFPSDSVAQLVESFFGGSSDKPTLQNSGFYTAGEKAVVQKFGEEIGECLKTTWEKLSPIQPTKPKAYLSSDLIEGVDAGTEVISCSFFTKINEAECEFRVLWPTETIKPLIPALKDQKRDSDPTKDARWASVIRSKVTDSVVRISSEIAHTSMALRDVAELSPGDIIDIDNPRDSTVFAKSVPVLKGLFGVHDGHYAIETTQWIADREKA